MLRAASSVLVLGLLAMRWVLVFMLAPRFGIKTAYDVYADLAAPARKLRWRDHLATDLAAAAHDFAAVRPALCLHVSHV